MANTEEILTRCSDLAGATFSGNGGACPAREAAIYLAHTGEGESLRALASATGTHPSTMMRIVRRVEARRDDPLVDEMITDLEQRAEADGDVTPAPESAPAIPRPELERAARRFLRRLSSPARS